MRYKSIDFYRGLTIAFMLIVNTPGTWESVYAPLRHADWNGCTPTDLVFPSFMFIIGVSMWFSFEKYGRQLSGQILWKILRRTAVLFGLGLLLAKFPNFLDGYEHLRIMGVLQRLALGYGLAALLALILPGYALIAAAAVLLLGYWGLLWWNGPEMENPYSLVHNYVRQFDLQVLGADHLWRGKGIAFDPEGILSTFPSVVTVLLGWWSGQLMQRHLADKINAVQQLLLWGCLLAVGGLVWDVVFPINKSLWTSSFVLYAGGISMILLAFSVWMLDLADGKRYATFGLVFGANPLFAYVLAGLLTKTLLKVQWVRADGEMESLYSWIYTHVFKALQGGAFGSLLFALVFMLLCWAVCLALYRRKIYIKI